MDERFGSVVANAGGMQVFANMQGDTVAKYETFWTPLGVVRFARAGWDSRLGPSDGARDALFEEGVTFGPTWQIAGQWVRLVMAAEHYQGTLRVDFVHPLLVRFSLLYAPVTGVGGPSFFHDFVVTPDGVLTTLHSPNDSTFGLTLPQLVEDGRDLEITVADRIAGTRYPDPIGNGDEQHFLVINPGAVTIEEEESVLSTYGWLRPARVTVDDERVDVFVYPRSPEDPSAADVLAGFEKRAEGFSSPLGRVEGSIYVGRFAAGGVGDVLDLSGDGVPDVQFDAPCGFIVQHENGKITAIEADADTGARVGDRSISLQAFVPVEL
jgi:hypothetical protein